MALADLNNGDGVQDRDQENPGRYILTEVSTGVYDLTEYDEANGNVYTEGTLLNAEFFNTHLYGPIGDSVVTEMVKNTGGIIIGK